MEVRYSCCAGLDVHKRQIVACLLSGTVESGPKGGQPRSSTTRTFGTTYGDLQELVQWLEEEGALCVAMESTGSYWMPVYNLLEGVFEVVVANAAHIKAVPGRKTDVKDSQWIAELLRYGLLSPSFIPDRLQRDLREMTRQRTSLVEKRAQISNELQKALESSNLKLQSVVTDITGVSALRILNCLLSGNTSPEQLADLAKGRLRLKIADLRKALAGELREHHRIIIRQLLDALAMFDSQIAELSEAISTFLTKNSPMAPPDVFNRLDAIPGINRRVAETIVAEAGTNMERFPTAGHFASWIGLCPGQNESAGKRRSGRTRKGNKSLRRALVEAAHGAVKTRDSYFGAQYRRLAARRGKKKAIIAVAHSLAIVIYNLLQNGTEYLDLGQSYFDQLNPTRLINRLTRRIETMGYVVEVHKRDSIDLATETAV